MKTDREYREWLHSQQHGRQSGRNYIFGWGELKTLLKKRGIETPYHAMGHVFGHGFREQISDKIEPPESDHSMQCGTCGMWFRDHQRRPVPCLYPHELTDKGKVPKGRYAAKERERRDADSGE